MNTNYMKNKNNGIQEMFKHSFNNLSENDKLEIQADVLAMRFIGLVDEVMEAKGITKKQLAERVGTSPSFITQVFRGNRRPGWEFLAKIQHALDIRFEISTEEKLEEWLAEEIHDYHTKWESSRSLIGKKDTAPTLSNLTIEEEHDYALAG